MVHKPKRRKPWRSWSDFTGWAQDFSLRKKVVGGFLAVVVLAGAATSLIGTKFVRDTIKKNAQEQLLRDLGTAVFLLDEFKKNVNNRIRLRAGSRSLANLLRKGDFSAIRSYLANVCLESDLDYLTITDEKGTVLCRAFVPYPTQESSTEEQKEIVSSNPLVSSAMSGAQASGIRLLPAELVTKENPNLKARLYSRYGTVVEAAYPISDLGDNKAILYGGVLLNRNSQLVRQISDLVFKGAKYHNQAIGYVSIYQHDEVITTSLVGKNGLPLLGPRQSSAAKKMKDQKGLPEIARESQMGRSYMSAAEPIRDVEGTMVGALELATQEGPITKTVDNLVGAFVLVAFLGVVLMAAISYFLVQWINRPLELMLNAARKAAEGDLSHEVPVIAHDEVGELAATFNLMIRNLAESQKRLEAYSEELKSKVAEQTGQLRQAREQVARVQKLASLEKMADGMSHIMQHISDPILPSSSTEEDEGYATSRVLVLDTDEKVLDVCGRALEGEGFEVRLTTSVDEALKELTQDFYDVVVADVEHPDLAGRELLKEIKYRQPDVIVVLTASFRATQAAVEAVELGAFDYIPKPFGPHQIVLMIYTALQTQQMLEQTRQQHATRRADIIFQRLPVAIALADDAHRVVYNNKAFVELATQDGASTVQGKTFQEIFGVDPLEWAKTSTEPAGSRWLELHKVGRTAKLYNFKLEEEDLRVLMLVDITDTIKKDQKASVFRTETISKAQQVIHQQMRVAQEIAQLLGETTAETKAALFELMKLAQDEGEIK